MFRCWVEAACLMAQRNIKSVTIESKNMLARGKV